MQRPNRPYITAATAGTGVLIGGVSIRAASHDKDLAADVVTGLLPMICIATVAVASLRRWLISYEQRTKASLHTLAEQHRLREDELETTERELRGRECRLLRTENTNNLRMQSIANHIDDLTQQHAADLAEIHRLRKNYAEVSADHDALVKQVVREGAARFTGRLEDLAEFHAPDDKPRPGTTHHHDSTARPSPVPDFRPREHQDSG